MKKLILNSCMDIIQKNNTYDAIKLEEIRYGLEGIYLTISKLVIIGLLAYFLNMFQQLIIFLLIYNVIRMPSFGLHATKSWICLLTSTTIFIGVPFVCQYILIPLPIKIVLGIILLILFYKNAPADTYKRPIVNPKRRMIYKIISTITCAIFIVCSIVIANNFIANSFMMALVVQSFMISPFIYKLFGLPYDNYKTYLKESI